MRLKNTKLRRITSTELLTLITIEQYSNTVSYTHLTLPTKLEV